jgi:hypothetical protein
MSLKSWITRSFVKSAIKQYAPLVMLTLVAALLCGYLIRGCTGTVHNSIGGTMENFIMVWGTVSVIVVWLTQQIGRKLPGDIPVLSFAVSLVLNGAAVYGVAFFLGIPWDIAVFWPYITAMQVGSQATHALTKTADKQGFTIPTMETKVKSDHSNP